MSAISDATSYRLRQWSDSRFQRLYIGIWTAFTLVRGEDGILYSCDICGRTFTKRQNYAQHYKHVHMKLRPSEFQCRLCDATFSNQTRAWHMEVAHDIPAPKCNICDRKFSHPHVLIRHQRIEHLGEKDFTCELCGASFGTATLVKRHMARHDDARPFECVQCEKTFKYRRNWKSHMQRHVKTCVCPICDDAFYQSSDLKHHVEVTHPELC